MMRIRLNMRRLALFLALVAVAIVALFPIRLAIDVLGLDDAGLTAREARGSVWLGRLIEARIGGAPLGDLDARLNLLPLMAGRARIDLTQPDGGPNGLDGAAIVTRHTLGIEDMRVRLPLAATLAPAPVAALVLDDVSVRFRAGVCDRASGLVRAEVQEAAGGLALPASLSGTARCDGGALLLPLASQSGMETLALRLQASGGYSAALTVRTSDPAVQRQLQAGGFAAGVDGYRLNLSGRL